MKLKLYHYWRSSCSWRVRWAMAIKGITCEYEVVDLLSDGTDKPEQRARNPLGYIPVLEFLGPNSPIRYLAESISILEWLEETYPSPALLPGSSYHRAQIRQLVETINASTQPLQNTGVFMAHSSDPNEQKKWNQHWITQGLQAYETLVRKTSGLYSMGDTLTLADLCLIPQVYNAIRNDIDLKQTPIVERIYTAARQTETCKAAEPERFKPS